MEDILDIRIEHLTKDYRDTVALDDVSLNLKKGMFGLLGSNGAGKTTLLKVLAGLLTPTEGEIYFNGESMLKKNFIRQNIGYVPQRFGFYPNMKVIEIMNYFAEMNMLKNEKKDMIDKMLKITHLSEFKEKRIRQLSGGMVQRLGIAVALLKNPAILLVDEPTVGLDPMERISFNNVLLTFSNSKVIVLSSHIVSDIESTCDKLAIMDQGCILFCGDKSDAIKQCKECVWEITTTVEECVNYENKLWVSSKSINGSCVILRVVTDLKPQVTAKQVYPNLSDAYIYHIMKNKKIL